MMHGGVTPLLEALVPVTLRPPSGTELQILALIDTGFDGVLALPPPLIAQLTVSGEATAQTTLADGSVVEVGLYRAVIVWHDELLEVEALELDGVPLLGMMLLHGSRVTVDVVDGGPVTVEPLS